MNCQIRSNIGLVSDLAHDKNRMCLPVEILFPAGVIDVRRKSELNQYQNEQADKILYYAKRIVDDEIKFPDKIENKDMCKDCEFRQICF